MTTFSTETYAHHLSRARNRSIRLSTAGHGHYQATSGSRPGIWYAITSGGDLCAQCSCPAGQASRPCCHAAAAISAELRREATAAAKTLARRRDLLRTERAYAAA